MPFQDKPYGPNAVFVHNEIKDQLSHHIFCGKSRLSFDAVLLQNYKD